MYDRGCLEDKTILIQAVTLMSFSYTDTEDRIQSWHWTGIAISLAQTVGLHRNPDAEQRNERLTDRTRRLWRRIWWCCFLRDRWQSLGTGRPMRINTEDCDVPMPCVGDITDDFAHLPFNVWTRYVPSDIDLMADHWIKLLTLSNILGRILAVNYRPKVLKPTFAQVQHFETEIGECSPESGRGHPETSQLAAFFARHVELHQE